VAAVTLLIIACLGIRLAYIASMDPGKLARRPSPVNLAQARAAAGVATQSVILVGNKKFNADYAASLRKVFPNVMMSDYFDPSAAAIVWIVPVREDLGPLLTERRVEAWRDQYFKQEVLTMTLMRRAADAHFSVTRIGGGYVLRRGQDFSSASILKKD
jgi:hypothetical protein